MALVFAVPYIPTAPPRPWVGLEMTWTGWDGSVWDITRAAEGVCLMPGVRGLSMPPIVHYTTSYASVVGSRWRGHTVEAREVFWPVQVFSDVDSAGWVIRERAFWKTMRPDKTGTWTVSLPSGEKRHLDCRFVDDSGVAFDTDPVLAGWSNYGINMLAHHPFWRAAPIRREWTAGGAVPFFPAGGGGGGGFTISPSATLDTATMLNPGDVDAYPVWEVHGPVTSAQVGVEGRNITIPFAVADGQTLIIDTDPTAQTATLYDAGMTNPVDKTMELGTVDFAPMPADRNAPVSLLVSGGGRITLVLTPLYLRAW